jgi:hypothetical protein
MSDVAVREFSSIPPGVDLIQVEGNPCVRPPRDSTIPEFDFEEFTRGKLSLPFDFPEQETDEVTGLLEEVERVTAERDTLLVLLARRSVTIDIGIDADAPDVEVRFRGVFEAIRVSERDLANTSGSLLDSEIKRSRIEHILKRVHTAISNGDCEIALKLLEEFGE